MTKLTQDPADVSKKEQPILQESVQGSGRRLEELRSVGGFLRRLRPFLGRAMTPAHGRARLERQMAAQKTAFIGVLEWAVFHNPASPYRRLFERAGITLGDVRAMLDREELESTLERLYDAGIYVKLEEFKGRRPLRRPGLDLRVAAEDFDNPLVARDYDARTGGSNDAPRRILVDLDLLEHESAYHALFYEAARLTRRALAIWHPAPPGAVGIKTALIQAKLGRPVEKWFSQTRLHPAYLKHGAFTRATILAARVWRTRIPFPEYTPAGDARRVAVWLAKRAHGSPAILVTTPSAAVRVCTAALDGALDIRDTFFVLVGEPYTSAKAAVVAQSGSRAASHYAMAEAGAIGIACQSADRRDDVHLLSDKVATIQRDKCVGANGRTVGALYHTTLLPASPKLMLNVESGDYAVREDRPCQCSALPAEYCRHLHTIRSYEKLTSEGMNFLGGDLLTLVEHLLPARFGGHPTDYQFIEREEGGLPKVSLVVRAGVGELDEHELVRAVLAFLASRGRAEDMMAQVWAQSRTLEVVRADPHVTPGGKIPALQTLRG